MPQKRIKPLTDLSPLHRGVLSALVTFLGIGFCVLLLSYSASSVLEQNYRAKLAFYVEYAASLIETHEHQQLVETGDEALYEQLLSPLITLHQSIPEATYLYTMVEIDNELFIVLDTSNSELINTDGSLEPSEFMEPYESVDILGLWIPTLREGNTYIDVDFFTDAFGTFISASAPLLDNNGAFAGFVGIDIDAEDYAGYKRNINLLLILTLSLALIIATIIGYAVTQDQLNIRRLHAETARLSYTDPLTGAYNRRFLKQIEEREWQHYKRHYDDLAIFTLDIDYFKTINDSQGHDAGDECLIQLVRTLTDSLRKDDYLIRMGGEEFTVLLPRTGLRTAAMVAERLRIKISELPILIEGNPLHLSISGGVSAAKESDTGLQDVIKRADKALYQAKEKGRNTIIAL